MTTEGIFKFENGKTSKNCSKCSSPLRTDEDFSDIDWRLYNREVRNTALFMEFCSACKDEGKKSGNANLTLAK